MAAVISGDRYKVPFAGETGNASRWDGYHKMPAAGSIGDTIDLFEIPAGAKIDEVIEVHSAHGTSATMAIGWKYKDGSSGGSATAIRAAASSAAAGSAQVLLNPAALFSSTGGVVDKPIIVYITNATTAIPLDGTVYVRASGVFVGIK